MNSEISREANMIFSQKGTRMTMISAFVYIIASAGTGLVISYLLLNFLDYFSVTVSDPLAFAVMAILMCTFSAPAIAGMRTICAALCDGRETSLSELFISFSSLERFSAAYLGMLVGFLRYGSIVFLFWLPSIIGRRIFGENENPPFYYIILSSLILLIVLIAWFVFTVKLSRLFYYLHSRRMKFFDALRAAYKGKYIVRAESASDILNLFLSFATCFTFFIIHAGPLFAIKAEISVRWQNKYFAQLNNEKLRKDGQK